MERTESLFFIYLNRKEECAFAESAMEPLERIRSLHFFDLHWEIRDEIYSRAMYFPDDHFLCLAPRGMVPQNIGRPNARAERYRRYREIVSLFTVSRQFRDEVLPIFWKKNRFNIVQHINLAPADNLPNWAGTAIDYIGPSGKMYLQMLKVPILCTLLVKPGKNPKYDADLGITLQTLLEMLPNLRELDLGYSCLIKTEDFIGYKETENVLSKAAEGLVDFLHPPQYSWAIENGKTHKIVYGRADARPLHARKQQVEPPTVDGEPVL